MSIRVTAITNQQAGTYDDGPIKVKANQRTFVKIRGSCVQIIARKKFYRKSLICRETEYLGILTNNNL